MKSILELYPKIMFEEVYKFVNNLMTWTNNSWLRNWPEIGIYLLVWWRDIVVWRYSGLFFLTIFLFFFLLLCFLSSTNIVHYFLDVLIRVSTLVAHVMHLLLLLLLSSHHLLLLHHLLLMISCCILFLGHLVLLLIALRRILD